VVEVVALDLDADRRRPAADRPAGGRSIVRTIPHLAFAVDDLDEALKGRQVLIAPNVPSPGVRVAFILDDGAPVELLEFSHEPARLP
jgi:hypothetical protein